MIKDYAISKRPTSSEEDEIWEYVWWCDECAESYSFKEMEDFYE
jgi:hypothetical protein